MGKTDREKVINALGRCESYGYCEDTNCPYYENLSCLELLRKDALELLKMEQPRCKDCLHYHKGGYNADGTKLPDNVGCCELHERYFFGEMDYCSYHTGV